MEISYDLWADAMGFGVSGEFAVYIRYLTVSLCIPQDNDSLASQC